MIKEINIVVTLLLVVACIMANDAVAGDAAKLQGQEQSPEWLQKHLQEFEVELEGQVFNLSPLISELKISNANSTETLVYSHYFRGTYLFEHYKFAEAVEEFNKALESDPHNPEVLLALAKCYNYMGERDRSIGVCEEIIKYHPDYYKAIFYKAYNLEAKEEYEKARAFYESTLELQPKYLPALRALASLYYQRFNKLDKAAALYKRILELKPDDIFSLIIVGTVEALHGDVDKALEYYDRAVRYRGSLTDAYVRLGQLLLVSNKLAEARKVLRQALIVAPNDKKTIEAFELLYLKEGKSEELLKELETLAEEFPNSADIQLVYARELFKFRKYEAAQEQFKKVLALTPQKARAYLYLGKIALIKKDKPAALGAFAEAEQLQPKSADLLTQIAEAFMLAREFQEAAHYYQKAIELNPASPDAYLNLFEAYYKLSDFEKAEQALKRLIEMNKENPIFHSVLAGFYKKREQYEQAIESFETARRLKPRDAGFYYQLLGIYLQLGQEEKARQLVGQGNKVFSDRASKQELYIALAAAYQEWGYLEEAVNYYEDSLELSTPTLSLYAATANLYNRLNKYDQAIKIMELGKQRLLEKEDSSEWLMTMGNLYLDQHKFAQAVEYYKKALELNKESLTAYKLLIYNHNKLKQYDEANRYLQLAAAKFGEEKDEFLELKATTLADQKRFDQAIGILKQLVEKHPSGDHFYFLLGTTLYDAQRFEEAEQALRKVIELNPDNPDGYNTLGYMFAERGIKLDEAEELIKKALQITPAAGYIIDSLGWVYFQRGQYEKALSLIEKAVRLSLEDAVLYEHLGDIYQKLNQPALAIQYWKKSLELDPDQEKVRKKLAEIEENQ